MFLSVDLFLLILLHGPTGVLPVVPVCSPTGVLPAVPPIPKAPGTLLPAFDPSSASPLDDVDETSSSQHSNPLPERFLF